MNEEIEQNELFEEKYSFKLDNYEGPIDLLLDLIKKSKMDIMDIKLALITDQYIEYMRELDGVDLEKATEFIIVAATLLEIKSKSILPTEIVDMQEDDAEANLILQIQEYKLIKEASEQLQQYENINRMYKKPDENAFDTKFVLKQMQTDILIDAFVEIMVKFDKKIIKEFPKQIEKDRFTVAEKIESIKDIVGKEKKVKFTQLFTENQTKSELINIFLAVLELMKMQIISIKQYGIYGEIEIFNNGESNEQSK